MEQYTKVEPISCEKLECLSEAYNLYALFDTPSNVIFIDQFINNIEIFKDIFMRYFAHENIFFSCKSNKSYALLKTATEHGCGIEVSSYFELIDALKFTNKIIASGPAKSIAYIETSINNDVIISVDDIEELKIIASYNKEAKVLLRISNIIGIVSRFGINKSQIDECIKIIESSRIKLEGISFHINNYSLDDRIKAIEEVLHLIEREKIKIKYIDIGGGLPTNYCSKQDFERFIKVNNKSMYFKKHFIDEYYPYYSDMADENALDYILDKIHIQLKEKSIELIIEPGRCLLKNVGISLYEVQYLKRLENGDNIVITNGNINCLSEQWFSSDYLIEPKIVKKDKDKKESILASVAGNLCLEQDMLTWRKIKFDSIPERGDLLIYYNTAGYQMDSNESEFHKIPLVKKLIVKQNDNDFIIVEDKDYDCK